MQFKICYRVDSGKNVHTPLGKTGFDDTRIIGNLKSFMRAIIDKRPQNLKGQYFTAAFLTSTMGPSWRINVNDIDLRSKTCML